MDDSSSFKFMGKPIQLLAGARKRYGPAPRFTSPDIVRLLWRLERRTGRARLAASLGVGEGSTRTMLQGLSSRGLADSAPMGHKLTRKGFACLRRIKARAAGVKRVRPSELTLGLPALALRARGPGKALRPVQMRDEAVKMGATGCTVLRFEGGRLVIPPFHAPTHRRYAEQLAALEKAFPMSEGDVLVIAYGGGEVAMERALWQVFSKL